MGLLPPPPLFWDQVSNGSENKEEITVAKKMLHTSLSLSFTPTPSQRIRIFMIFFFTCQDFFFISPPPPTFNTMLRAQKCKIFAVNSFFLTCMTCEFSLLFNINHIFQIICKPFNNVTYHVNNEGILFFFYGEGVINHLNSLNKDSKL